MLFLSLVVMKQSRDILSLSCRIPVDKMMMSPNRHYGDDNLDILPKEGSISTCESKWSVFYSDVSQNERKRNTCDKYKESQSPVKMSKTFRMVMKKYCPTLLPQRNISRLEYTICHSQAYVPCVKSICK